MKQLFPIEIQENTVQNHFVRRNTKSRIIYWIIIFSLILLCISLPFIDVDVTSQSRSLVRGHNENNTLQSALYGEIIKSNIYENKEVKVGDTLIWLRTDELDEKIIRLNAKIKENDEFVLDLSNLIKESNQIYTPKYKSEYSQYQAKLAERKVSVNQAQKEYQISKALHEKGVESKFDFEQVESKFKAEESQFNLLKRQQLSYWESERTRLMYETKDLKSELLQTEKRKIQYTITAPISGNIVQFIGIQEGNFLSPGQAIAQITSNDSLLLECYVSPNDIGYIHIGQPIKLQVDAFDYQQWGLLDGIVTEVISDVTQIDNQSFFRVRCILDKNYLELPNGYKGSLKKGMSGTTRFFLTRRNLAQLLFDKINDWINPKIINNGN